MRNPPPADAVRPNMDCRAACGACCVAPSISSPIPGMPDGKPAGVPCIHLTADLRCAIFDRPDRPRVCGSLSPALDICGTCRDEALSLLGELERATAPESGPPGPPRLDLQVRTPVQRAG